MSDRTKPILSALSVALGSVVPGVFITSAAQAQEAVQVEEVVVTGSMLRRPVSEQSQLITTVGAEELERAGAGNAVEALVTVAQNQPNITSATSPGFGTGFGSYANLRSLSSSNTLVLFDSKRVALNAYKTNGVDLNSLPLNMIDRVETLSDGASAVYGSDAIAGVINFVLRREYQGLSVSLGEFLPEHKGGERQTVSISGGIGDLQADGWNIYAGYSYHDKERIRQADRDFSDTAWIPERGLINRLTAPANAANWTQTGTVNSPQNPQAPACSPPVDIYTPTAAGSGPNACQLDSAALINAQHAETDQSFLVNGSVRSGEHTARLQYFRAETDLTSIINSTQFRNANLPNTSPYYPGNASGPPVAPGLNRALPVQVTWRVSPAGLTIVNPVTTTDRILAELDGKALGWNYDLYALRSTSSVDIDTVDGYPVITRLLDMLSGANGAPFINPFGPQSAAAQTFVDSIQHHGLVQTSKMVLEEYNAQISRNLIQLPAGPLQFAIAANARNESAKFSTTQAAIDTQYALTALTINGERDIFAITSEFNIPILENLEVDLALRYDHYSDFGSTTNPKILISWDAMKGLNLHASYNKGFRAPTLHNLYSPVTISQLGQLNDPVLCPGGVVSGSAGGNSGRDCNVPMPNLSGGNPDLGPETSKAYAAGLEFRPNADLRFGLDYWRYHIFGTIGTATPPQIFADLETFGPQIIRCSQVPSQYSALPILYNPATGRCVNTGSANPIAFVNLVTLNLGEVKTSGVDLTADWRGPEILGGTLSASYRGTVVLTYDYQNVTNGPFFNRAGEYRDGQPVIDYSHFITLTWETDPLTLQLSNRFLAGYLDCNAACLPAASSTFVPANYFQKVGDYSLWDLTGTFHWNEHTTLTARVTNLLDTDPPFSNRSPSIVNGWDERFTDPTGRAYSLTVRYKF